MRRTREVDISSSTWIEWYRNTFQESFRYVARDAQSCRVVSVPHKERRRTMLGCYQFFDFKWESHLREKRYDVGSEQDIVICYPGLSGDM